MVVAQGYRDVTFCQKNMSLGKSSCCQYEYRGISLLSIPGKVYALILRSRLENWAEGIMSETQSGFRPGRGCNDAIFCLKMLYERALLKQKPVFTCFIDLSKAYDSANRQLAWKILRSRGAPGKIVDLIQDLHRGTTCAMQSDCSRPENWFEVATGFKQGDVNAPLLFTVYIDTIVRVFLPSIRHLGVKWSYKIDGHIRECRKPDTSSLSWIFMYADDIALVAESDQVLQQALTFIDDTFIQRGMEISVRKTQIMRLASTASVAPQEVAVLDPVGFHLRGHILEEVDSFKYLGSI